VGPGDRGNSIADVGFYLAYRAFHAVPFLWKFHAIHHSIKELDWLAAHRVHPLDQILTSALSYLPLFALGFSAPAIIIQVITYQWQSHLIHSNTRLGFGPLRWIFASPQFHHWHHANERAAYDTNFSAQLTLMDALAGTLRMPKSMPTKYGVDDPVPDLYHQQLVYPLMPAKKEARISGEPEKVP
jgi:sterol desaturase/sphingolipid hydroxylase (fatty acid hydroxylase superfamily)